jgi:hypothetical protein
MVSAMAEDAPSRPARSSREEIPRHRFGPPGFIAVFVDGRTKPGHDEI